MKNLWADLRYALRQLRKSPGFTVTAILTLALGIGATSAIYTVVDSVVLKPLAFRDFGRLAYLRTTISARGETIQMGVNPALMRMYQQRCHAFNGIAAYQGGSYGLTLDQGKVPQEVGVLSVTKEFFPTLGNSPTIGRFFTSQEFAQNNGQVAVISNRLWQNEFHADPNILGKSIRLDGQPLSVVGVLPPSFRFPQQLMGFTTSGIRRGADVYTPFHLNPASTNPMSDWNFYAIAQLRPGATLEQANDEMNAILAPLAEKTGGGVQARTMAVPLLRAVTGKAARGLWLLFGAVGCVLLIACINLANLQLARSRVRAHEHAVRAALGASGSRLFQYSLMESTVLALAGCVGGIFLAFAGVKLFLMLAPRDLPRIGQVHVSWETLAVTALLSIGTGLFFGITPALAALRADPQHALHEGGHRTVGAHGGRHFGFTLIALEVIACTVLLMAAALLTRSFQHLLSTSLGFAPQRVISAQVDLGDKRFDQNGARLRFYKRVLPVLRQLPGVASASMVTAMPTLGDVWVDRINIAGDTRTEGAKPDANFRWISPEYFQTLRIPLLRGRTLNESDLGTENVVLSQAAASAAWPNQNPLGRTFEDEGNHLTVVGVVGNTRSRDSANMENPIRMVYEPYSMLTQYSTSGYLMVRASGNPGDLGKEIQRAIWSVDPTVPIPEIRTLPDVIRSSVSLQRFEMWLLLAFGLAALGLAALGIYGVLAITVAERKRDLAVRIALGANKRRVFGLVLRQGMVPAAAGLIIGLVLSWIFAKTTQTLLPDIAPTDPISIGITIVLLLTVALAACFIPAQRAASVDPMATLRAE